MLSTARLVAAALVASFHPAPAQLEVRNSLLDWDANITTQPVNGWFFHAYRAHDPRTPASYVPMVHFRDFWTGTAGWRSSVDPLCSVFESFLGILQSPSKEWEPVRAWIASANGVVTITPAERIGRPIGQAAGDGVRLQVWRDAWRALDVEVPPDAVVNVDFRTTFAVNAGDVVYFHCTRNRAPFTDGMQFQPQIVLNPGPGYDPNPRSHDSATAFGAGGPWIPEGYDHRSQQYEPMAPGLNSPDSRGAYFELQNNRSVYCRVWRNLVHPLQNLDTVLTYVVPDDGQVLLRDIGRIAKRYSGANPVDVRVFHRPVGTNDRIPVRVLEDIDRSDRRLGKALFVRRNDRVSVHVQHAGASNLNMYTRIAVDAELHPRGAPRPATSRSGSWTVTGGQSDYRFYERITVDGDLDVHPGGELELDDCIVRLDNAQELDHTYRFAGKVVTRDSVIGGNRLASQADRILHSNFVVEGEWESFDTEVRYTFGQSIRGTARFRGDGHVSVADGDFVDIADQVTVDLRNSVIAVAFALPVDRIGGDVDLDLKVDRYDTTLPQIPWQGSPDWTGTMQNTMVYAWIIKVNGLNGPATGQSVPYEIRIAETTSNRVGVRMRQVTGGTGTFQLTDRVAGIAPGTSWQAFNSRWRAVGPGRTFLQSWAADFRGSSTVRLIGPGASHELMAFDRSLVNLVGTPGTFDAHSNSTRIQADGDACRMVLDNCTLGLNSIVGEVRAARNAQIAMRDVQIDHPLCLRADDASNSRIIVSSWSGSGSLIRNGRVFEVDEHWSFDDNDDGWRSWDPAPRGFVRQLVDWPASGASAPANAKVYRLDYPARASYGNSLNARIVAPGSGQSAPILFNSGDLYLYARVRAQIANPRRVGGQPVVRLQFSSRDPAIGWSSWGNYFRDMELIADGQFHSYCWRLTDPGNSPDPIVAFGRDPQGGTSLPAQTDYWGLRFNGSGDVGRIDGAQGDFVEVDFLTVADRFDSRLRN